LGLDLEKGLGIDEGSIVASADGRVAKAADTKASTRRRDGH
jgi:hypothetical protein